MKILFMLSHPAQYHFAKHIIRNLKNDGHNVLVAMKSKDILEPLLKEDGIDYVNIQPSVRKNNKLAMLTASLKRTFALTRLARRFGADVLLGTDSSVAQSAFLLHKLSFTTLEDDAEIIPRLAKMTFPFSTGIIVPECCSVGKWADKKTGYRGYMKLAYLHPNRFAPDVSVVRKYISSDRFCLVRLAKLAAHHDEGIGGLDLEGTEKLARQMETLGYSVYIHSEIPLNEHLEKYHLNIASSDVHHILSYASLLVSDSQSMSMEAAMLGTPSIRFSGFAGRISVLEELEHKYGLTYGIPNTETALLYDKVEELLKMEDLRGEFALRRQKMLSDKIDVTAFFTWFIENYPESRRIMVTDPDCQMKFR